MKKGYFKIVSVILIIALLIQSIPITAFAQETAEPQAIEDEQSYPYVIAEDVSKREEYVKHFRMSDGSFTAVSYSQPVHYLDEDNKYVEIDNSLVEQEESKGLSNVSNPFKVTLPQESDGEVNVEYKGNKVSFKLLDTKKVKNKIKEEKKEDLEGKLKDRGRFCVLTKRENTRGRF